MEMAGFSRALYVQYQGENRSGLAGRGDPESNHSCCDTAIVWPFIKWQSLCRPANCLRFLSAVFIPGGLTQYASLNVGVHFR